MLEGLANLLRNDAVVRDVTVPSSWRRGTIVEVYLVGQPDLFVGLSRVRDGIVKTSGLLMDTDYVLRPISGGMDWPFRFVTPAAPAPQAPIVTVAALPSDAAPTSSASLNSAGRVVVEVGLPAAPAGRSILSGYGQPAVSFGSPGDFYIDLTPVVLYGPKTTVGWGAGVSLVGPQGAASTTAGPPGKDGADGRSAYLLARDGGYGGTQTQWLASLKGDAGANGTNGTNGTAGTNGLNGTAGQSAYQVWLAAGNTGTVADYLASLKGAQGATGPAAPRFSKRIQTDASGNLTVAFPAGTFAAGVIPVIPAPLVEGTMSVLYVAFLVGTPSATGATFVVMKPVPSANIVLAGTVNFWVAVTAPVWLHVAAFAPS